MSTNYCEIVTSKTTETVLNRLRQLTIQEQPFLRPKGIYFLGKINNSKFNIITFNTPPVDIEFTVSETSIKLKYETNTLVPLLKTLIYALGFPIAFALFIWALLDKDVPIEGKIILAIFLLFPFFLNKIFKFILNTFFKKKEEAFLNELEQLLDVKIIVSY